MGSPRHRRGIFDRVSRGIQGLRFKGLEVKLLFVFGFILLIVLLIIIVLSKITIMIKIMK